MKVFAVLRNVFAIIGVLALIAAGVGYAQFSSFMARLDPGAADYFAAAGARYLETLDPGLTVVKSVQVEEGMSTDDVIESLRSLAVQHDMLFVGEAPFYKQIEAITGEPYRFVSFFSFCDARVGAEMIDYHSAYSAFMPCRIALVEDEEGRLWLHMMDLDMFIHGGRALPDPVREGALRVRDSLNLILDGAAVGEF